MSLISVFWIHWKAFSTGKNFQSSNLCEIWTVTWQADVEIVLAGGGRRRNRLPRRTPRDFWRTMWKMREVTEKQRRTIDGNSQLQWGGEKSRCQHQLITGGLAEGEWEPWGRSGSIRSRPIFSFQSFHSQDWWGRLQSTWQATACRTWGQIPWSGT